MITQLKEKVLNGGQITREEAILLSNAVDKQALYRAAGEINGVPNRLCLKRI